MDDFADIAVLPAVEDFFGGAEQIGCCKPQNQFVILPERKFWVLLVANLDFMDRSATVITVKEGLVVDLTRVTELAGDCQSLLGRVGFDIVISVVAVGEEID